MSSARSSAVHELALMNDLVETVLEKTTRPVRVVRLVVGKQSGVAADALRFSFEVCADGTRLTGAVLDIIEAAGRELELKEIEVGPCV
jgi:hydrogenase nickel incorporation protein HypA/HybF